ncbi:MAG TPA: hypothetical protein VN837_04220 [Chloroflexota bacterium]|nr:hypothetical protein [Chloroflexota bacterium]
MSKYTPERAKRVLDAIGTGAARCHAAAYGGIDHNTLLNWEHRYPEFKAQVLEAEARAVVGTLAQIRKSASEGDWRAGAWLLERRYPEEYGRTVSEQRHSGPDGTEPVKVTHALSLDQLSDADLALLERLARLRAGPGGDPGGTGAP